MLFGKSLFVMHQEYSTPLAQDAVLLPKYIVPIAPFTNAQLVHLHLHVCMGHMQ